MKKIVRWLNRESKTWRWALLECGHIVAALKGDKYKICPECKMYEKKKPTDDSWQKYAKKVVRRLYEKEEFEEIFNEVRKDVK